MEQRNREIRTLPMLELRFGEDEGKAFIEGHAAVFDNWSETLGGIFPFKEKVKRGAFSESIMSDDIRALFNHDPNYVLGRNRAGTLELREDEQGLFVKIAPPDTTWAKDLRTSIERGDITQMSFRIPWSKRDNWYTEKQVWMYRDLERSNCLMFARYTFPRLYCTDVGVRGMERYNEFREAKNQEEEEKQQELKREAQEKQRMDILKRKLRNL